jgi:Exonuclease
MKSTITAEQVDRELCEYISKYVPRGKGYLAGNSVHLDKDFMKVEFPSVIDYLSYRIVGMFFGGRVITVDVSSIKVLCKFWSPRLVESVPVKNYNHRAMDDIKESIDELRYYKDQLWQAIDDKEDEGKKEEIHSKEDVTQKEKQDNPQPDTVEQVTDELQSLHVKEDLKPQTHDRQS